MLNFRRGCFRFLIFIFLLVIAVLVFQNLEWILKTIYPVHHYDLIEKYSNEYDVDPYLVAAIMKNESRFDTNAISKKDAKGLMQIAPVTGQWAAEKLKIPSYSEDMLFEPELNIHIGIWYLNVLKQEFGNNIEVIIAGYNAGNGNVKKWLSNPNYSQDGRTLDEIPFSETKIYQKRVLRDYEIYSKIYK